MENQVPDTAPHNELRGDMSAAYGRDPSAMPELDEVEHARVEMQRIDSLRIPVGTNLADAERWMIFATLQKCGGNKTRAAALLGVSLKTLYNRLNAYRAQGLAMDYDASADQRGPGDELAGTPAAGRGRGLEGNLTETQ
jgi:DNA-binding NtrC family response regulator